MRRAVIKLNNWLVRRHPRRVRPEDVLILSPRCLQNSACRQGIVSDPGECLGCGRCDVKDLLALARRRSVRLVFVAGGGLALECVRQEKNRAIIAVACEKELFLGLLSKRGKPVLTVSLERPCGPCRDTRVPLPAVEEALRFFLGEEKGG